MSEPAQIKRRTVLLGISGVFVAGCSKPSSSKPGDAATTAPDSPDLALVGRIVVRLESNISLLGAAIKQRPGTSASLQPLLDAHQEHLEAVRKADDQRPTTSPTPLVPGSNPKEATDKAEWGLQKDCLGWAGSAESGQLARLIASIAASIAQHTNDRTVQFATPADRSALSADALAAFQKTLAGEHAAMYLYSLAAAQVSQSANPRLSKTLNDGYDAHRALRDQLMARITASGDTPAGARAGYQPPNPMNTVAQQRTAALLVEQRCANIYGEAVAATVKDDRSWAVNALRASAQRALPLGGRPQTFPGYA